MISKKIKILYITCCDNGFFALKALSSQGYSIAAVITISPQVAERNAVSGYVDIREWCIQRNLECITLENYQLNFKDVQHLDYELIVVNGWNRLIHQEVINSAPLGGLGLHAGHPPIGLGRSPLVWNIILGHSDLEVYCFKLTAQADDGAIYSLQTVEITPFDNAQLLYEKVMRAGKNLIIEAINKIAKQIAPYAQNLAHAKHYAKRTPEDGAIDFSQSAIAIYNFVRAQTTPYPGAFCHLNQQKWHIHSVIPFDRFAYRDIQRLPGQIVEVLPSGIVIQTGTEAIWLLDATIDGDIQLKDLGEEFKESLIAQVFT